MGSSVGAVLARRAPGREGTTAAGASSPFLASDTTAAVASFSFPASASDAGDFHAPPWPNTPPASVIDNNDAAATRPGKRFQTLNPKP